MAELAENNSKDARFQDRFAAMLARHEGRKVRADARNIDQEGRNYDADTSNISEMGGDNYMSKNQIMVDGMEEKDFDSLEDQLAKELVENKKKRVLVQPSKFYAGDQDNDADMSGFEAAPRRKKDGESKSQIMPLEGSREWKNEIVGYNGNGRPIPRWVQLLREKKEAKKARKLEREAQQHKEVSDAFDDVLARHGGKKNGVDDGKMNFEMNGMMIDNRSDYGSKRKRQVEDENELTNSMQHMQVENGRKR